MAVKPVPITGAVLEWALEDAGTAAEELALELGVDPDLVLSWIDETKQPNTGQFRKLVRLLGRPETFFFLPQPPTRSARRVAFRFYAETRDLAPPPQTREALNLAEKVRKVTTWIRERLDAEIPQVPNADRSESPEEVGRRLRAWLGWSFEEQTKNDATDASVSRDLRSALQDKGITVLALTLDEHITRGFSTPHTITPLIAVNTRDHIRARIFSYAHELAHLALNDDSLCLTGNDRGLERYCNRVAAALLMPADEFHSFARRRLGGYLYGRADVVSIRNHFHVSLQAAVIRADDLKLAAPGLREQIFEEREQKQTGGRYVPGQERTRPLIRVDQYGQGFVGTLLDAEEEGVLDRPKLLSLLRVSDAELRQMQELVRTGRGE